MSKDILGNNQIKDVRWLCSLSESELDMLISLKKLAMKRSETIGYDSKASKFDPRTLWTLSLILMEHIKGEVGDTSGIPGLTECPKLQCKLLSSKVDDNFTSMSAEELAAYVKTSKGNKIKKLFC